MEREEKIKKIEKCDVLILFISPETMDIPDMLEIFDYGLQLDKPMIIISSQVDNLLSVYNLNSPKIKYIKFDNNFLWTYQLLNAIIFFFNHGMIPKKCINNIETYFFAPDWFISLYS